MKVNEQLDFFMELNNTISEKANTKSTYHCMVNGVYGNYTPEQMGVMQRQVVQLLKVQEEAYKKYIGKVVGDFTCESIEYDWGTHKQIWTVRCNTCGKEKKIDNGYQWSRGKTYSNHCDCWYDRKKEKIVAKRMAAETTKKERQERRQRELDAEIGKIYGHFEVIECYGIGEKGCVVKCLNCGETLKSRTINQLRAGNFPKCKCERNVVYDDDPKWIGVRNGHLVSEKMENGFVVCRCDCGRIRRVQKTSFFKYNLFTNCADPECEYANDVKKKAYYARKSGNDFELMTEMLLHTEGYKTEHIGKSGDYGIDIIATDKSGMKIAIQCKCNAHGMTSVKAVQEVYAGGRYYDLEHFAVVAFGEVSANAVRMAKKLGVYISDGKEFVFPEDMKEYAKTLVPTVKIPKQEKLRKLYELNGEWDTLPNWAIKYGTSATSVRKRLKSGLSLENALKYESHRGKQTYTVNGITGNITELCRHFAVVSPACVSYRLNNDWSVEEAFLTPKAIPGRPAINYGAPPDTYEQITML